MKFKIIHGISLLIFSLIATESFARYLPNDLEQFKKTGNCSGCDLSGANFADTFSQPSKHNNSTLKGAMLVNANLNGAEFFNTNFDNAKMMYAAAQGLKASGSSFKGTNLTDCNFKNASLSSADFSGAILNGANFEGANLALAKITKDQLNQVSSLCNTIMPEGYKHPCN